MRENQHNSHVNTRFSEIKRATPQPPKKNTLHNIESSQLRLKEASISQIASIHSPLPNYDTTQPSKLLHFEHLLLLPTPKPLLNRPSIIPKLIRRAIMAIAHVLIMFLDVFALRLLV